MHDPSRRRKAQRQGRERGCWVYVPLQAMERARVPESDSGPYYRLWASTRGTVVVRFYGEP